MGLLYLHEGVWNQDTLFTKEWHEYSISRSPVPEDGSYGAHIWLSTDSTLNERSISPIYFFSGYQGQYVYIIPDYNAVVVRMGLDYGPEFSMNQLLNMVLDGLDSGT